jgi:hypothetical protein
MEAQEVRPPILTKRTRLTEGVSAEELTVPAFHSKSPDDRAPIGGTTGDTGHDDAQTFWESKRSRDRMEEQALQDGGSPSAHRHRDEVLLIGSDLDHGALVQVEV